MVRLLLGNKQTGGRFMWWRARAVVDASSACDLVVGGRFGRGVCAGWSRAGRDAVNRDGHDADAFDSPDIPDFRCAVRAFV